MRRALCLAFIGIAALGSAGCGTSPPAHFYTLSAVAPTPSPPSSLLVAVGPVTIPAVVDRPEFVVNTGPNELHLDEFNRWASPLQDNLARTIAEDLTAMLGTPHVILFPQALASDPDFRVAVELRSFQSTLGGPAVLDAVWTIRRSSDGRTQTGRSLVQERATDASYEALAAAHSRAVARLSQDIADAIRVLQSGGGTAKTAG